MTEESKTDRASNKLLSIGIGCILMVITLNVLVVNPNVYLYTMYKFLTGLGVSIIANGLTGNIKVELNGLIGVVKAGGSLALLIAIIYFYPIVPDQRSMYTGNISIDQCTDSTNTVYIVLSDRQQLYVKKGDRIDILELNGKQDLGPVVGLVGVEGKMTGLFGLSLEKYNTEDNIPHGAAIFRLSNNKQWKSLSDVNSILVDDESASIEFNINDEEKENNYGFFFLKLRLKKHN